MSDRIGEVSGAFWPCSVIAQPHRQLSDPVKLKHGVALCPLLLTDFSPFIVDLMMKFARSYRAVGLILQRCSGSRN
jgi:hypothetical protein